MRKGIVIAGAVVLIIGAATLGAGLYLLVDQAGVTNLGVNAQKTTLALAPGASSNVGTTMTGMITIVAYSDNTSAPIQVTSGGISPVERTATTSGVTEYISVFTDLGTGSGSAAVIMHNNQTKTVSVQYAAVQSSIGALAYGGLAVLGGGLLFIIGLVVLIVGFVMKKRVPPGQAVPQQP